MPETQKPFETSLDFIALEDEDITRFRDLLEDARSDYQPRNFGERHLVDELAICKWRQLRVLIMQRAIYDRQQNSYDPTLDPEAAEDLFGETFNTAMAHSPDRYGHALTALGRLETRYHRQFCEALRLLNSLQKENENV